MGRATSSATDAESTAKWDAIWVMTQLLRSPAAGHFGRLCDMALEYEARRARAGDIPVRSGERLGEAAGSEFGHASGPIALNLYADVLWFRGRLDAISGLVADVDVDARELDRRGLAHESEGAEAYLYEVALALCVDTSARTSRAVVELLDSARPAALEHPAVLAMIDVAIAAHGLPG